MTAPTQGERRSERKARHSARSAGGWSLSRRSARPPPPQRETAPPTGRLGGTKGRGPPTRLRDGYATRWRRLRLRDPLQLQTLDGYGYATRCNSKPSRATATRPAATPPLGERVGPLRDVHDSPCRPPRRGPRQRTALQHCGGGGHHVLAGHCGGEIHRVGVLAENCGGGGESYGGGKLEALRITSFVRRWQGGEQFPSQQGRPRRSRVPHSSPNARDTPPSA